VDEDEKEEEKDDYKNVNGIKIKESVDIFKKMDEENEINETNTPTPGDSIKDSNTDSVNSSSNSNNNKSHNVQLSNNSNGQYLLEGSIISAPNISVPNPFKSKKTENSQFVSTKSSDLKNSDN
jgi:hypothetical protein